MKVQDFLQSNSSKYVPLIKCGAQCAQFRNCVLFFLHHIIKCKLASIPDVSFKL